jgi:hypothetical protein
MYIFCGMEPFYPSPAGYGSLRRSSLARVLGLLTSDIFEAKLLDHSGILFVLTLHIHKIFINTAHLCPE